MKIQILDTVFYPIDGFESPLALWEQIEADEMNLNFEKFEIDPTLFHNKQLTVLPHLQKYRRLFLNNFGHLPIEFTTTIAQSFIKKIDHYPLRSEEEKTELRRVFLLAMSFLDPQNFPYTVS